MYGHLLTYCVPYKAACWLVVVFLLLAGIYFLKWEESDTSRNFAFRFSINKGQLPVDKTSYTFRDVHDRFRKSANTLQLEIQFKFPIILCLWKQ